MKKQLEKINEQYVRVKERLYELQKENVEFIGYDLVKDAIDELKMNSEYPEGINSEYIESKEGLQNIRKEMGEILIPKAILRTLYVKDVEKIKPLKSREEWRDFLNYRNKMLDVYPVDTYLTQNGNEIGVFVTYEPPYYEYRIESNRSVQMDFMGTLFFLANLIPINLFVEKEEIKILQGDGLTPFCVQDYLHLDLLWDLLQTVFTRDEMLETNHLYILLEEIEELVYDYTVYVNGLDLCNFVIEQVKKRTDKR